MRQPGTPKDAFMDFAKFTGCLVRLQDRNAKYPGPPSSSTTIEVYDYTTPAEFDDARRPNNYR